MLQDAPIQDNREFKILDIREGKCTHVNRTDKVFLIAFMSMDGILQTDITVVIKNEGVLMKAAPHENEGISASIFCGAFLNNGLEQVLLSVASHIGDLSRHYLYGFHSQAVTALFNSEESGRGSWRVEFQDGYKAILTEEETRERHLLDLQYKQKIYLASIYDGEGALIKSVTGGIMPVSAVYPVYSEAFRRNQLLLCRRITGINNSDTLGYLFTRLGWNGKEFMVLENSTSLTPWRRG